MRRWNVSLICHVTSSGRSCLSRWQLLIHGALSTILKYYDVAMTTVTKILMTSENVLYIIWKIMLIKVHEETIVWKSVVFELLQFEGLLNKEMLLRQWRESFILFSIMKEKLIFKFTQKAIFVFFLNKYTHFLKVPTGNVRYKLILSR